ncbi:MAG: glycosyltransferase family 9 protein [Nitrospinota bacterium]|nr:glycosyltransferase family 9 protein [Nitrospinota bacterium]
MIKLTGDGRRLVFVASGGLGDCLLLTPFLRALRRSGKYGAITVAVQKNAVQIYDHNPHLDHLAPCHGDDLFMWALEEPDADLFAPYIDVRSHERENPFSVRVEPVMAPNPVGRPIIAQVAQMAGMELSGEDAAMEIHTTPEDIQFARGLFSEDDSRPVLYINTSSNFVEKQYPADKYREVARLLEGKVRLISAQDCAEGVDPAHVICPAPGLRALAEIMKRVDCVLSVDSFPQHLAAAVGTPAVTLFGASNPEVFGHDNGYNISSGACPSCADTPRRKKCQRHVCMESIDPGVVVDAVLNLIEARTRVHAMGGSP